MTGEKTRGLPGNPLEVYRNVGDCLGQPRDFHATLHLSLYAGLQLITSVISNLVFLIWFYKTFFGINFNIQGFGLLLSLIVKI